MTKQQQSQYLVSHESENELLRPEDGEHAPDQIGVVRHLGVRLEAHVRAVLLGRDVDGEVVAPGQQRVRRVAARLEQERVEQGVGKQGVDARAARALLATAAHLAREKSHHLVEFIWVEIC